LQDKDYFNADIKEKISKGFEGRQCQAKPKKMYQLLKENISRRVTLSNVEFEAAAKYFKPKQIKRKEYLLREGEVCTFSAFVNKGCLRAFSIDRKGIERVTQFSLEDHWAGDIYSLITHKPTELFIEALEDCDLLILETEAQEKMFDEVPKMERMFRLLIQNAYVAVQKRLNSALSSQAEERYLKLLDTYPDLLQRVPLIYIASYLGITPESLSRIRNRLVKK
jgi:CRP-like cAMP-binding protein